MKLGVCCCAAVALVDGHGFMGNDRKSLANTKGGWQDPLHHKETTPDTHGALHWNAANSSLSNYDLANCVKDETADVAALMRAGGGTYAYMDATKPEICMSTSGSVCADENGGSNPAAWYVWSGTPARPPC
jgi:hypothetical protein